MKNKKVYIRVRKGRATTTRMVVYFPYFKAHRAFSNKVETLILFRLIRATRKPWYGREMGRRWGRSGKGRIGITSASEAGEGSFNTFLNILSVPPPPATTIHFFASPSSAVRM